MNELSATACLGCFLRSYMVGAAYNPLGLQNIGFLYAMEPALVLLYGPGERLREARLRYARNYNCHPFLTPVFLGVLLRMETAIAAGRLDPSVLESLKDTTANTLSAIGDSFFNGTLLNTWALTMACLVLGGMPGAALAATGCLFALLQLFKLGSFIGGFRSGLAVLVFMRRLDLINWSDRIRIVNAVLLALFLWLALPEAPVLAWGGVVFYLLGAGWLVGRRHLPRIILALALLAITVFLHMSGLFGVIPALLPSL